MHAGNALNLALSGGIVRPCVILFIALELLIFHIGAREENNSVPHPPAVQLSSHTEMSDVFDSLKPRMKKQLRRLIAL
ncbi:hypothetical protein BSR04_25585 [Serratia plymuthica]|jgi:hypothetical protein|uniref:Uncharacterized protein n=1 Tax=Serratia plymuthica TaxID=82996 RepID=A0A318P448_SERPL|nr:hypothetical protein BSR04_25585 [Serratia plymuthica]PYD36883.1 hypothetical protein CT690_22805 [Serratia plymuthica]